MQAEGLVVIGKDKVDQRAAEHHRRGADPDPVRESRRIEAIRTLAAPVGRALRWIEFGHPGRVDGREGLAAVGQGAVLAEPVDRARDQRALAVDQPRVAGGEAYGIGLVEMGGEMTLKEILVPQIIGVEKADERRLRA